jgi:hypothetical protein
MFYVRVRVHEKRNSGNQPYGWFPLLRFSCTRTAHRSSYFMTSPLFRNVYNTYPHFG